MAFRQVMKNWYEPAAIPIYVVIGVAVGGAGYYMGRLATGPDVVWDRHGNPEPWNRVQQGENIKFGSVNQKFDKPYRRHFNIGAGKEEEKVV